MLPGPGYVLFYFFLKKSEKGGSQGSAQGPGLEPHARLDIGNNMAALDFEPLGCVPAEGKVSVSVLCFLSLLGSCLTSLCPEDVPPPSLTF